MITWTEGVPRTEWRRFASTRRGPVAPCRPPLTPEQRRMRAKVAAHTRWSKPGARAAQSARISEVRLTAHEARVDPAGVLDPRERRRLATNSLAAEMSRLALRSSVVRGRRRG